MQVILEPEIVFFTGCIVTTNQPDRRAKNAPDFSVNWSVTSNSMEMVHTATGKMLNNAASRLSKCSMFDAYIQLCQSLAGTGAGMIDPDWMGKLSSRIATYSDAKQRSTRYQSMKKVLHTQMRKNQVWGLQHHFALGLTVENLATKLW